MIAARPSPAWGDSDGLHRPFSVGIAVPTPGNSHALGATRFQKLRPRVDEERIPSRDEMRCGAEESVDRVGPVAAR